jgi:hypothetical protein
VICRLDLPACCGVTWLGPRLDLIAQPYQLVSRSRLHPDDHHQRLNSTVLIKIDTVFVTSRHRRGVTRSSGHCWHTGFPPRVSKARCSIARVTRSKCGRGAVAQVQRESLEEPIAGTRRDGASTTARRSRPAAAGICAAGLKAARPAITTDSAQDLD